MKIAFVTEMGFTGKVSADHPNMRTEFAWMYALNADHYNINNIQEIKDYDCVFIIFPKGRVFLSAEGSKIINSINPVSDILATGFTTELKQHNKKVYFVQEGPAWWFNDYELVDQFNFIVQIRASDGIFAHNVSDINFWKGYTDKVYIMPTLMLEHTIENIKWSPQNKTIIGGNFSRWYGGMQSFIIAQNFENEMWTITSHSKREREEEVINHLPRVFWTSWMEQLSTFKYAVHMMPTVAAGTFSLNCAYFGIPCIGNKKVDTQRICHPHLSIDVEDIAAGSELAIRLKTDSKFYNECSRIAKENYNTHYKVDTFISSINNVITK